MVALYADENVQYILADELRLLGYDVLTAGEDGRAGQGIEDEDVLARAIELDRSVITNDRDDYRHLHRIAPNHAGIITYTKYPNIPALAARIHAAIAALPSLHGQLIKIIRPNP